MFRAGIRADKQFQQRAEYTGFRLLGDLIRVLQRPPILGVRRQREGVPVRQALCEKVGQDGAEQFGVLRGHLGRVGSGCNGIVKAVQRHELVVGNRVIADPEWTAPVRVRRTARHGEQLSVRQDDTEGRCVFFEFRKSKDCKYLYVYRKDWKFDLPFEVAGADGVFHPAELLNLKTTKGYGGKPERKGDLEGERLLVVGSKDVAHPVHLRYLHCSPWTGYIFNEVTLPLGAFHIDCEKE